MKKTLVILLLVTLVFSKQFDSYVLTNDEKLVTKESELNTSDLIDVLKHNFGSLVTKPSEQALKFIKETGKTAVTIFNPIRANFLVLINGNLDKKSQEKIVGKNAMKTTLDMENIGSNHLFDQIFNTENTQSLINTVYTFSEELKKKEFYIFSQDKNFSNYYENFGISIAVDEQGNVVIEDKQVKEFHNREKFQKCVKKAIDGQYRYEASQNTITNISTKETLIIDQSNAAEMQSFLSELCGMHIIASSFKKETASFLALEINSLPKIQKVLTAEGYAFAQDVLAVALKKVTSHYEKAHKNTNFGQIIFAETEDNTYLVSKESKNMKVRLLTATALTPDQVTAAQNYTLRSWFSIFFVALVFFVCYALFSTEITKDSLLYAKFIAEERR